MIEIEEKKKRNWVFPTIISLIILGMISIFLIGYKSSVKLNDENKTFILNELNRDSTLAPIDTNSLYISPYVGSLVNRKNGKVINNEEMQNFSFKTKTDSTETNYEGWLIIEPKFMGYDIIEVRVNK